MFQLDLAALQGEAYNSETMCVGLARVGSEDQTIVAGPMSSLMDVDFGGPLHSLIIAGTLHSVEEEILNLYQQK